MRRVVLRLYGSRNTGKKTLAHQIHHVASSTTPEQTHVISTETEQAASKTINFLLNGEEIELEIVMESTLESSPFANQLTMYVVVYSVDSRESFKRATNLLYSFVEVSALLSMNMEAMWAELIKQIQDPSDFKPADQSWVHRLLLRGRHIAKSCEEIVQRIIA
ncbi:hypothetical protein ANCCAN_09281 [Ancylostoma caninum]|uniref:Uncharacterized protein n=1 Tax=Ancylostoma caninum TaxID=29170 RepID=A0A368GK08_ANCCA|nr:hypothetical protein ANCCAN_09281 [Ancylostoma caninum]